MKLNQYLLSQFAQTFFPIFLGLYFITSIVFLVKIAALTSVITMDFIELFRLYMYVIPNIIFYTVPVSFFVSLVITLAKLSNEYELIVITSFGLNPIKILKVFFPVTLLLSIGLFVTSVGLIPKAKFLNERFLDQKTKEANFNIKASEFGQKFGDWLIYISNKDDKKYHDVKLFQTFENKDQFIIADNAVLDNNSGDLSFKLFNGKSYHIEEDELNQIDYKSMDIKDSIRNDKQNEFTTSYEFWKKWLSQGEDFDKFTFYVLTSLFPLISLFLVISFGYFNPRYDKNRATAYSMVAVVIYYVLIEFLTESLLASSLIIVPIVWILGTYIYYHRTTKKQY